MKETYILVAGASFVAMLLAGLWPKACLSKFQKALREQGEDPHQRFGLQKMKQLDPKLYRNWKAGFIVSSVFAASFVVSAFLAFLNR